MDRQRCSRHRLRGPQIPPEGVGALRWRSRLGWEVPAGPGFSRRGPPRVGSGWPRTPGSRRAPAGSGPGPPPRRRQRRPASADRRSRGAGPSQIRKEGTALGGVVADRDHQVEVEAGLVQPLRALSGDVDPRLGHDGHRPRVEAAGLEAGGVGLEVVAAQVAGPAFGHLAAAGVPRAQEQQPGAAHDGRGFTARARRSRNPRSSSRRASRAATTTGRADPSSRRSRRRRC